MQAWFEVGVIFIGLGSQLSPDNALRNENHDFITDKVKHVIAIIRKAKRH